MKKTIFALLAMLCFAVPAFAQDCFMRGDADADGQITPNDISVLIDYLLNGEWPAPEDSNEPDERAIDLGLPSGTLWASMNIGATSETGTGLFLSWGESAGKASYDEASYDYDEMTIDCIAGTEYDPATNLWGGRWTTPTKAQWDELKANTIIQKTNVGGVDCFKVRCKTDASKYIYLPMCGQMIDAGLSDNGYAWYWSSTQAEWNGSTKTAYYFFGSGTYQSISSTNKRVGLQVRPVWVPKAQ